MQLDTQHCSRWPWALSTTCPGTVHSISFSCAGSKPLHPTQLHSTGLSPVQSLTPLDSPLVTKTKITAVVLNTWYMSYLANLQNTVSKDLCTIANLQPRSRTTRVNWKGYQSRLKISKQIWTRVSHVNTAFCIFWLLITNHYMMSTCSSMIVHFKSRYIVIDLLKRLSISKSWCLLY